jgi:hypothetical protein
MDDSGSYQTESSFRSDDNYWDPDNSSSVSRPKLSWLDWIMITAIVVRVVTIWW